MDVEIGELPSAAAHGAQAVPPPQPPQHSGSAGFPGVAFADQAAFDAYCAQNQALLDARFVFEQQVAQDPAGWERDGSCGLCLQVARFCTQPGDAPDWRDGQHCQCADHLSHRARACLHLLHALGGLQPGGRLAMIGSASPLDPCLARLQPEPWRLSRLLLDVEGQAEPCYRFDAADGAFDAALCWDYLQRVPPLAEMLGEIRRVLAPGGQLVFTLPFHYLAAHTRSRLGHLPRRAGRLPPEFRGEIHEIGWDILAMLREAGFEDAWVHHYWSDELGYLGAFNLLLSARVRGERPGAMMRPYHHPHSRDCEKPQLTRD